MNIRIKNIDGEYITGSMTEPDYNGQHVICWHKNYGLEIDHSYIEYVEVYNSDTLQWEKHKLEENV